MSLKDSRGAGIAIIIFGAAAVVIGACYYAFQAIAAAGRAWGWWP